MQNAAWILVVALASGTGASQAGSSSTTTDRPLVHLVTNLEHDLTALPRLSTAASLAGGLVAATAARTKDTAIADWVHRSGSASYTRIGTVLGNGWTQGSGAVATYAIGLATDRPGITELGSDLIRAQALNGVLTTGLKYTWARTRPNGGPRSFPSGHSSASFASATILEAHFGWKVGLAAYAAAGFVGWTRVRGNYHWLSDVVFGSAVGVVSGRTVAASHRHRGGWHVVPAAGAHGAALYLVHSPPD